MSNQLPSDSPSTPQREPIAIIGVGCRLPGGVHDLETLWDVLKNGTDTISDVPETRYDLETFFDPRPRTPGKLVSRQGGFINQKLEEFDAAFFKMSPREASILDPQQRFLLESTWEAIEDAGLTEDQVVGSPTGVFVAMWTNEFEARIFRNTTDLDLYSTTGSGRYAASGRISFAFDLHGPSLTIDSACSSSLVALHLAIQSVRSGESEMAIVGASNLILEPQISLSYSRGAMLSPQWRCKFGDAEANGYVRSEGVGVLLLKPLSRAIRDGNTIHALVLGSSANNDGQGSGLMVSPSKDGQADMLRAAYRDAGISASQVGYLEAHGTGTPAGDPIELAALNEVLAEGRAQGNRCVVGSAKTNFGHTEGAAGLVGVLKTILVLKHRAIPASLHFNTPTPKVNWNELALTIPTELTAWETDGEPRYAGVNAFGITGTNAHVVLQEAPLQAAKKEAELPGRILLPVTAHSPEALAAAAGQVADSLERSDAKLADILFTAARRRWHHDHRLAVSADSRSGLIQSLRAFAAQEPTATVTTGQAETARKIVFVFPGQGSQWAGMGRQLYDNEPAFRQAIERCADAFRSFVDWSLVDQIQGEPSSEIDVVQPTLFAMEVALAETWRAWGVEPDAVVGHSMGEPAAAYIAGALSLTDAARVICTRSRLMKQVSGKGSMVVVDLTVDQANAVLADYEGRLSVAVSNGPRATVISGDRDAVEEVTTLLEAKGTFVRPVKVDVAAHSPHMDPLRPELVRALAALEPLQPSTPVYSTVTASEVDFHLDAEYWGRNLRQPVLFHRTVDQLVSDGYTLFIECSPHPILLGAIEQNQPADPSSPANITIPSMRRGEDEIQTLLRGRETVFCSGGTIQWQTLYPSGNLVKLPAYPFQREHFWDQAANRAASSRTDRPAARLVSGSFEIPDQPGSRVWQAVISLETHLYLADHRVNDTVLLPAAAFLEMIFEAASELPDISRVEDVSLTEALTLLPEMVYLVQVVAEADHSFRIFSRARESQEWTEHGHGRFSSGSDSPLAKPDSAFPRLAGEAPEQPGSAHVAAMHARGLNYGPAFRAVNSVQRRENLLAAKVQIPASVSSGEHFLHPVLLDAAIQLLIGSLGEAMPGDSFIPVRIRACQTYARPRAAAVLTVQIQRTSADQDDPLTGDVRIDDEQGQRVVELQGLEMRRFHRQASGVVSLMYDLTWRDAPPLEGQTRLAGSWLICSGDGEAAQALAVEMKTADGSCQVATAQPDRAIDALAGLNGAPRVVFLAASDRSDPVSSALKQSLELAGLVRAIGQRDWPAAPRVWVVTRTAQSVLPGETVSPGQTALWGLAATIQHEYPAWHCTRIDLAATPDWQVLVRELGQAASDPIALRPGKRFSAHLTGSTAIEQTSGEQPGPAGGRAFRLEISQPGLPDTLRVLECERTQPGPGQVLIETEAVGLNFIDVMRTSGIYPGMDPAQPVQLGLECAGTIAAIGAPLNGETRHLAIGQRVMAFAPYAAQKFVTADAHLVQPVPAGLSAAEAAGIPVVFLTTYYALCHLGRMRRGERVLIHSAAGGVGLAAIQVAQHVGAEVFATAGTEEKRTYLRSLGIQHVMDSRSTGFADQIMEATGGQGVDLVLNSLTGEAITRSLAVLAPYGRFLEIGKRDIYQNTRIGLFPFQKNLSYFAIDLDRVARERAGLLGELFGEVVELFNQGHLHPLPVRSYAIAQAGEAVRRFSEADHIGKIVLDVSDPDTPILPLARPTIRPQATYLITGGLGALGLTIAGRLVQQGARCLALVGRSPEEKLPQAARDTVADLRSKGIIVAVLPADISRAEQVETLIQTIRDQLPPLAGIIHAAGLLEDGILSQMTDSQFARVFAPKVAGAWNLHEQTRDLPLDFFVLFSSITSALGSPGQGNYSAANAFMDGLAYHRHALGLKALSINWGPWGQIGLAATRNQGGLQGLAGLDLIDPKVGLSVFEQLLNYPGPQAVVTHLDAGKWLETHPGMAHSSVLSDLKQQAESTESTSANPVRASLLAAPAGKPRQAVLEGFIQAQAAEVLRMPAARIELQKPLRSLGMDSLMAIEFRNRLESKLEVSLSASLVFNYPSITELTPHLAAKMEIPLDDAPPPAAAEVAMENLPAVEPTELENLSDADLSAMLDEELKSAADLLHSRPQPDGSQI